MTRLAQAFPETTRTIVVAWVRLVPWPAEDMAVHSPRSSRRRTEDRRLRTGDYSEIGPVLSPSLSVVTPSLSSIATSRLAIGVFLG